MRLGSIDSTNAEMWRRAESGDALAGDVVVAREQHAGRGRRGRSWVSVPGAGLFVSTLHLPGEVGERVGRWSLGAALAACEACRAISGVDVRLRWPNDLIVGRLKVAGILAEMRSSPEGPARLVIGTGINVRHDAGQLAAIGNPATSLEAESGARMDLDAIEAAYLDALGAVTSCLDELGGGDVAWTELARRWEALAPAARGTRVRVVASGAFGVTEGLDDCGALRIRLDDGRRVRVLSSESIDERGATSSETTRRS